MFLLNLKLGSMYQVPPIKILEYPYIFLNEGHGQRLENLERVKV